jgi:sugar lactone lactonase YvrE
MILNGQGKLLLSLHPESGAVRRWPLPERPGSFALRKGGGFIFAFEKGDARMVHGSRKAVLSCVHMCYIFIAFHVHYE